MNIPSVIVLAAGHGGKDTGALSPDGKHNERDQVIRIVDLATQILSAQGLVVDVAPHEQDTDETIAWLNRRHTYGSAWAIEIHRDSAEGMEGPEASLRCGVYHGSSVISTRVARRLLVEMKKNGAVASSWTRDQKQSRFSRLGWIAQPHCLSHLVELGFMQGRNDPEHMRSLSRIFANALVAVIDAKGEL